MTEQNRVVTDRDGLSIGIILSILAMMATGVAYAVRSEGKIEVTNTRLDDQEFRVHALENRADDYVRTLQEINTRLSHIEGGLGLPSERPQKRGR